MTNSGVPGGMGGSGNSLARRRTLGTVAEDVAGAASLRSEWPKTSLARRRYARNGGMVTEDVAGAASLRSVAELTEDGD